MESPGRPPSRARAVFCLLAAGTSLFLAVAPRLGIPCDVCTGGLVPAILPWAGAAFYGLLAGLCLARPGSALLTPGFALATAAHAALVAESLLDGRLCPGCLAVAALAWAASGLHARAIPADRLLLGAGLVLGGATGAFHPAHKLDDALLRRFFPARLHDRLPEHIDRSVLAECGHGAAARLLVFEKNCSSCRSVVASMLPRLHKEFAGRICTHVQPAGAGHSHTQPLLVITSRGGRMAVIEGHPVYDDVRRVVEDLAGR